VERQLVALVNVNHPALRRQLWAIVVIERRDRRHREGG
jgi:hypothetical protein